LYVYVACFIGIFSKLRSLNVLSQAFDEQQFFVNEDEFEQTNNSATGDLQIYIYIYVFDKYDMKNLLMLFV